MVFFRSKKKSFIRRAGPRHEAQIKILDSVRSGGCVVEDEPHVGDAVPPRQCSRDAGDHLLHPHCVGCRLPLGQSSSRGCTVRALTQRQHCCSKIFLVWNWFSHPTQTDSIIVLFPSEDMIPPPSCLSPGGRAGAESSAIPPLCLLPLFKDPNTRTPDYVNKKNTFFSTLDETLFFSATDALSEKKKNPDTPIASTLLFFFPPGRNANCIIDFFPFWRR